MFFDVDLNQVKTLVEKTLEETLRPAASAPTPAPNRAFREMDHRHRQNRAIAKGQARAWSVMAQVQAWTIQQREQSLALCPCPPPPMTLRLEYVPEHLKNWLV